MGVLYVYMLCRFCQIVDFAKSTCWFVKSTFDKIDITYILYNMTIFSVYPIENYNRGMGGSSNFARPMLPTYRGCTVIVSR